MAVDEIRERTRRKLEALVGAEETSYLMDRPPGGWSDLVTNQVLDAKLGALEHRLVAELATLRSEMTTEMANLRAETREYANHLLLWIVPTIFAGITGLGVAAGLLS
jgi:hypothetical protein